MKPFVIVLLLATAVTASPVPPEVAGKAVALYTVAPKYGRYLPEGKGWFGLTLDSAGRVRRVAVVTSTGYRELDSSAIAAFKQWRFKPGSNSYIVMPVNFTHRIRGQGMHLDY